MKKWFFLLLSLPLFLGSCNKSDGNKCSYTDAVVVAPAIEIAYLQNYITTNSISATQHPSGIFYTIDSLGTGGIASVCSNITVNYTGSFIPSGVVFDSNNSPSGISFTLGQLIIGWQKAIPLIRSGGQITVYCPPSLAYGPYDRTDGNGNVVIPGNSYLKFTVILRDVQ